MPRRTHIKSAHMARRLAATHAHTHTPELCLQVRGIGSECDVFWQVAAVDREQYESQESRRARWRFCAAQATWSPTTEAEERKSIELRSLRSLSEWAIYSAARSFNSVLQVASVTSRADQIMSQMRMIGPVESEDMSCGATGQSVETWHRPTKTTPASSRPQDALSLMRAAEADVGSGQDGALRPRQGGQAVLQRQPPEQQQQEAQGRLQQHGDRLQQHPQLHDERGEPHGQHGVQADRPPQNRQQQELHRRMYMSRKTSDWMDTHAKVSITRRIWSGVMRGFAVTPGSVVRAVCFARVSRKINRERLETA